MQIAYLWLGGRRVRGVSDERRGRGLRRAGRVQDHGTARHRRERDRALSCRVFECDHFVSTLSLSLSLSTPTRDAPRKAPRPRDRTLRQAGFTYGEDPNDAYTWDREMVRGCHCDESYAGYDCSLRVCEKGDDPLTPAVESLECSGRGLCDRSMGTCQCFSQYGASDGNGAKGTIDDCGYVLPLALARETTER